MIYFTRGEILYSFILSMLFGIIYGFIYKSLNEIFAFILSFYKIVPYSIRNCQHISIKRIKTYSISKNNKGKNIIIYNLLDLIFFTSFGCIILLIIYTTLDGVIRLYVPLTAVISFLLINKTAGNFCSRIINRSLYVIKVIINLILEATFYFPIKLIYKIRLLINDILNLAKKKFYRKRSERLISKKIDSIKNISRI